MSLEEVVQNFLNDPNNDEEAKNNIRSLMTSHLATGMKLQQQGLLHEAIEEFTKENNRPIHSDIDKEISQNSYWHIGMVYRKLGDAENTKKAFQRAYELFKQYHVGKPPHDDLAEIMIAEGQFDKAIVICQEILKDMPGESTKQLLAKALEMKENKS